MGGTGAHDLYVLVDEYMPAHQGSVSEKVVREGQSVCDGLYGRCHQGYECADVGKEDGWLHAEHTGDPSELKSVAEK